MFLYWLETAVVALYSVLTVVTVGGLFTLIWLPAHLAVFGVFMRFHLMMILPLGPWPQGGGLFPPELIRDLFARTWGAAVGMVVSHGISFLVDFLGNREYTHTTVNAEVMAPWKRLLVMHVTTLLGAWSVMLFEAPLGALSVLSLLRIVVDVHGHLAERSTPSESVSRASPAPATKTEGVLALFGAFLVFCGVVLAVGTGADAYRAERIESQWPTVNAEVLDCGVRENIVDRARHVSHTVRCRFRYEAAGAQHIGTLWTHSTQSSATALEMRRWVGHHRSGTTQPIHFDPSAPDRISLGKLGETIDPPLVSEKLTAAGGFAGAGALLLLIVFWRSRRSRTLQGA